MRRWLALSVVLFIAALPCLAQAQAPNVRAVIFPPTPAVAAGCAPATTFLARTSGVSAGDQTAVTNFMCGLVTDGLFTSAATGYCTTNFDIIYLHAITNQATALLNLCSSSFTATITGALTFTADSGFTGAGSANNFINTNFNASTAGGNYTQNSAHQSAWNLTNVAESIAVLATASNALTTGENLYPKFADNSIYARLNDNPETSGFAITDSRGHLFENRSTSTARQLYQNASTTLNGGTVATYGSSASQALQNSNFSILGNDNVGSTRAIAMYSAGASLNSTQVTNFYNRLRTYMTAVGVP